MRQEETHTDCCQMASVVKYFVSLRLRLFQKFDTFRILVCGGDGSVGWVLSEIDALTLHKQVPSMYTQVKHHISKSCQSVLKYTVLQLTDLICKIICKTKKKRVFTVSAGSSPSGDRQRSGQSSGLGFCL